jgi:mono/diheme cytochrome c family protein
MHIAKTVSLISGLGLTATLCVLLSGLYAYNGVAIAEERPGLMRDLDLWSQQRKAAPRWDRRQTSPDLHSRAERQRAYREGGVPLEYRSRRSPYPAAKKVIHNGGRLYRSHCTTCHGSNGFGNGEAGRDLTPLPALLAHMIKRPRSVDEYLLWTISEGGAQFGSEMPTFKEILTEKQIWQIVSYMRGGFPVVKEAGQD